MNVFQNLHLKLSNQIKKETITFDNKKLKRIYFLKKRTKKDNEILYNELQNYPCFQNIIKNNKNGEIMYSNIIKRMEIKIIRGGEPLYRCRENISSMSFILEGKIIIYKKPKEYKLNKNKMHKLKFIDKIVNAFQNSLSSHIFKDPDYYVNKGEIYGFNDMKKHKREVLSEAATNFCVVGELSLNDYIIIFEKTDFLEKQDILNFLGGLKMFENIYFDFFDKIYIKIIKKQYKKNEYVCKKNEPCDRLIIIRKGSFKLYFNSKIQFLNEYDLSSFSNNEIIKSGNTKQNLNSEINNSYDNNIEYHLINVGKGEVIGDIEFSYKMQTYFFNLKCDFDNSQILEIPFFELYKLSTRELKEQIRFVTNEKIQLYIKRIEEIKNVNLKMQNRQNQYKNLILLKIQKSKGKILEKLDKKEKVLKYNNKKLKLILTKNINSPDKNIQNMDYFPTNHSNKYNKKPLFFEFHKISHNNSSSKLIEKKTFLKHESSKFLSWKNYSDQYLFKNKLNKQKSSLIKPSVIFEKEKKNYSSCFEINKLFVLKNNTSMISKSLKDIFMNCKDKQFK